LYYYASFIFIFTSINTTFANNKKVGILYDERFLLHDTGPNHPENPERLIPVIRDLKNNDQITANTIWPNFQVATVEELSLAHSKEYIELVDRQVSKGIMGCIINLNVLFKLLHRCCTTCR
jgi:acetoin utilization deacetylase AcuC-like enzyme